MLVSCSMKHIVEAIEGITLQCRDQLHQLLPLRQSGRVCIGEVYDQLEVCVYTVCLACCRLGETVHPAVLSWKTNTFGLFSLSPGLDEVITSCVSGDTSHISASVVQSRPTGGLLGNFAQALVFFCSFL